MDGIELLAFGALGLAVLVHIVFVSITIGTGWISAGTRFLGWRRNQLDLEIMSRRVFKILIVTELFSGVWGTIITVILAGFYPTLMAIAADVLFYPLLISLSFIMIRIPAIVLFWYTWGKIRDSIHVVIGFVMAIAGLGVPLGFRFIWAELTSPYALTAALQGSREAAHLMVFANPLYPPLILHTVIGALSLGGFIVASYFAIKGNQNAKFAWIGLRQGVIFLGLQAVMGVWFLLTLGNQSVILYSNVLGAVGSTLNLLPIFASKMVLITALVVISALAWRSLRHGVGTVPRYMLSLGPLAAIVVIGGEFMNGVGRYPYMLLTGTTGIRPSAFMNFYIDIPLPLVYLTLSILMLFTIVFAVTVYYALSKRFLADLPEI
ncbi:MAG: cytochrome ubiquinol oxidase subunit I [Thaumarchaeota archaeon]|nr:cytochrome ubiquinol oxidase subunit I [Nitrososphaerota archaeon]MCL5317666.1 cytochrome ubiquinol oxidase subunit I [Nitrososphaerota archaeon]